MTKESIALTSPQLTVLQLLCIEALKDMRFDTEWLTSLALDLRDDHDRSSDGLDLANYISWHMVHKGELHVDNQTFADVCALKAVMLAMNSVMAQKEEFVFIPD